MYVRLLFTLITVGSAVFGSFPLQMFADLHRYSRAMLQVWDSVRLVRHTLDGQQNNSAEGERLEEILAKFSSL